MYKILIIEDDYIIANEMKKYLKTFGYKVKYITDFENVISEFISFNPHIVLLDISLPIYNGYYYCEKIRQVSKVPIIFVSSNSDNMNIIMAINMGGDDFIVKPFDLNVLNSKIQAMLRRTYDFIDKISLIEHKGLILNISEGNLVYNENTIDLTKNEYKIIKILMENKGKIVNREDIMARLWETDSYIDDNTLTVNIARLRKKLENVCNENFIKTKKGIGYILD